MNDSLQALEGKTFRDFFAKLFNAEHTAHGAFIQAGTLEMLRRALQHQVRPLGRNYDQAELVYFKRDCNREWKGPDTVIGQDGKVVIVRYCKTSCINSY